MLSAVRDFVIGTTAVSAQIEGDVLDIARRLHEGDPTVGWLGDPTLSLHLAVEVDERGEPVAGGRHRFEVWGIDAAGDDYLCLVWPRCDSSLLRELVKGDVRVNNVAEQVMKANEAAEKAALDQYREETGEAADRLHHALLKDIGHAEGGLTRRVL